MLDEWTEDDALFVSTKASSHVLNSITRNSCVTVTGNPGIGKTATVRHVALKMRQLGYIIVPTNDPHDIRNLSHRQKMTLFVFDDLCGKYDTNPQYLNTWLQVKEDVESLLKNKFCKIISTCRIQVYKDEKLKNLSFLNAFECNLSSNELRLSDIEKHKLIDAYFTDHQEEVFAMSNEYDFFPLLCKLFKKEKHKDIRQFFKRPFEVYKEELDCLRTSVEDSGKQKLCSLALCVIFNNQLKEEYFTERNHEVQTVIQDILCECDLNKYTPVKSLQKSLEMLKDIFIVKDNGIYRVIHDKLFDFLAYYMGQLMISRLLVYASSEFINERFHYRAHENSQIKDMDFAIQIPEEHADYYVKRLIKDWSNGEIVNVFANRNMHHPKLVHEMLEVLATQSKTFKTKLATMTTQNANKDTTLIQSCFIGNIELTKWITDLNVGVNKCRADGTSPLYIASEKGYCDIVQHLLHHKADVNKVNNKGIAPLYIAAANGFAKIVQLLIKNKADVNHKINTGLSPLHISCYKNCRGVVSALLGSKSINVDLSDSNGRTALFWASQENHLELVTMLLHHKASVDKCMENGMSAFHIACNRNFFEIVQKLLIVGKANINLCDNSGNSPLYSACRKGHVEIVDFLLEHNADVLMSNESGVSPLQIASTHGHDDIVKKLLMNGACVSKPVEKEITKQ